MNVNDSNTLGLLTRGPDAPLGAIIFEGVALPPLMRPQGVQATFGFGHGALYSHLSSGRIKSIAVKGNPSQRRCTRLVYTQSVIEFLRSCEMVADGAKNVGGLNEV